MMISERFRDWLVAIGGEGLLSDSYSFKNHLISSMSDGFETRGPKGAISRARIVAPSVGERLAVKNDAYTKGESA